MAAHTIQFRAIWYIWEAARQDAKNPSEGAVVVVHVDFDVDNLDRKLKKDIFEFHSFFPLELKEIHACGRKPPWWHHLIRLHS